MSDMWNRLDEFDTSDQNSWWGAHNTSGKTYESAKRYDIFQPVAYEPMQAPSDWADFRQAYGGGYANEQEYNNWRSQRMRENSLASFVDRMASQDPSFAQNQQRMTGAMDAYGQRLNTHLDSAGPTMSTSNRFEGGLSANEARLNALLTDPNSIQQTGAYKFRVGQGQEAIQRQMAAKGMLGSGNRLMELTKYGQDMASQEYENQHKRLSDLVGMYSQNWIGDKNANVNAYNAESQDWGRKGGILADVYGKTISGVNDAVKIGGDNRVQWGNVWANQAPAPYQTHTDGSRDTWHFGS